MIFESSACSNIRDQGKGPVSSWGLRLLCEFQKIQIFVSKPVGHRECFNTQNVMVKRTCSEYLFPGDTQQSPV